MSTTKNYYSVSDSQPRHPWFETHGQGGLSHHIACDFDMRDTKSPSTASGVFLSHKVKKIPFKKMVNM